MGEVYRALDPTLGREVALKTLPADLMADEASRQRFEREARALASLNHPNIVTIHAVDRADGQLFLTMELVAGQPLSRPVHAVVSPTDPKRGDRAPRRPAIGFDGWTVARHADTPRRLVGGALGRNWPAPADG